MRKTALVRVTCIQNTQIRGKTIEKVFEKLDTFWTYQSSNMELALPTISSFSGLPVCYRKRKKHPKMNTLSILLISVPLSVVEPYFFLQSTTWINLHASRSSRTGISTRIVNFPWFDLPCQRIHPQIAARLTLARDCKVFFLSVLITGIASSGFDLARAYNFMA
jgi:hypothetical protein